jgi:hypothetical protein
MGFKKNAVKAVEQAMGLFDKVQKDLTSSIALCETEMQEKEAVIAKATSEKAEISTAKARAEKVLGKVNEFLS